jgi:hypothetical protein
MRVTLHFHCTMHNTAPPLLTFHHQTLRDSGHTRTLFLLVVASLSLFLC